MKLLKAIKSTITFLNNLDNNSKNFLRIKPIISLKTQLIIENITEILEKNRLSIGQLKKNRVIRHSVKTILIYSKIKIKNKGKKKRSSKSWLFTFHQKMTASVGLTTRKHFLFSAKSLNKKSNFHFSKVKQIN